ncbi:chemotaxis protein CheW [Conexibacter sp. SYSU D00693]|uniref:chemotaxis protein CheW n=1 Tax=Conexibacter sp. SYSU D00693 TaxID=2812560 RepID=UPI00196B1F53|nr:chemotaxis protein CheW [Conexibacter sp. SYSU D00693]
MSADTTTTQLVVFSLAGEEYALPISHVHEIIRYAEPRSVASSDPSVRGVISLRGKILPVLDLAQRLGLDRAADGVESNIVIVETDAEMAGVICDEVEEVITVESSTLEEAPGSDHVSIDGIAKIDDRLVVLLNPHGIVPGAARRQAETAADEATTEVAVAA